MHQLTVESIIVGMDVHKYAHTAVAMNCLGQKLSDCSFSNDEMDRCVSWLSTLGAKERLLIGLEDTNGNGIHLTNRLHTEGFSLTYVPPVLTDRARKSSVHHEKSDQIDAMRVGKAILTRSEEALPASMSISSLRSSEIRSIDLLLQERTTLVREQTELKNQLHGLLHQYYGNGYRQSNKNIFSAPSLCWYETHLKQHLQDTNGWLAQSIIRRIHRLQLLIQQIAQIGKALQQQSQSIPTVEQIQNKIHGCGPVTACMVIAEIGSITRFATHNQLARYCGSAPVARQSAGSTRVVTDHCGNRKLNRAIHLIALSQIGRRGLPQGQLYYQKKCAEGKSKLWALRCLKRQIVKTIFTVLTTSN